MPETTSNTRDMGTPETPKTSDQVETNTQQVKTPTPGEKEQLKSLLRSDDLGDKNKAILTIERNGYRKSDF